MNLKELFDQLAYGELSQHKFGKNGSIAVSDYPALISHVECALTSLHSRLPLKHKEVLIEQKAHLVDYKLDVAYALSNTKSTEIDKYILDSEHSPFIDDIIKIEGVFDGNGEQISLNNVMDANAWFTPNPDTLQVPYPIEGNISLISYRANHPMIGADTVSIEDVEIDIPICVLAALRAHIGSRCYVALGSPTSAQLSSFYNQVYNNEIAIIEDHNLLQSSDNDSGTTFLLGGWR